MSIELGDREQQYYAELFQACDVEGSGKITGLKASELFRASGLNPEILKQITELCGAKRLGHFGRSQFYIALKLVALAQAGLPLKLDALHPGKEIPLPKFSSKGNEQADRKKSSGEPDGMGPESKPSPQMSGQLPPPPKKSHMRSLSGQYRPMVPDGAATASPANPVASGGSSHYVGQQINAQDDPALNSKSPPLSPPTSPVAQKQFLKQHTAPAGSFANSLASAAPAVTGSSHTHAVVASASVDNLDGPRQAMSDATNDGSNAHSVAVGNGAGASGTVSGPAPAHPHPSQAPQPNSHSHENGNWAMFEEDESHMLLGSGVKHHYNSLEPPNFDSSSISSEAESVDDIWSITEEQREYYINQFKIMQPDLNNMITGPVAKQFFEKSKLPVTELSKIWNLSDLNHDGALSVEEFCIAMHLVVLRRNEIELPDRLPLSLMPYSSLSNDEPFAADLPPGSTLKRATPPSSPQNTAQWTAFVADSPESSGVSSPATLANFEFSKPSADPDLKIVQPVAVHISPESLPLQKEGIDRGRAFSDSAVILESRESQDGEFTPPLTKQRGNTESHVPDSSPTDTPNSKYNTPIQGRPRPVPPKKHNSVPAIVRGQLQPPPASAGDAVDSDGGPAPGPGPGPSNLPPTPPPRPPHGRSMSVDIKSAGGQLVAPAVPPRVSPKEAQAAAKPGDSGPPTAINELKYSSPRAIRKSMAPSHRRAVSLGVVKLGTLQPSPSELTPDAAQIAAATAEKDLMEDEDMTDSTVKDRLQPKPALALRQGSRDRRDIHMAVRTHKERNSMLTRLNSELNQELQEVMEQRIALEIQLEHLRPFSS